MKNQKDSKKLWKDYSAQHEVDCLWKWYEIEKQKIMEEEYNIDIALSPDLADNSIYYENYIDHWRVEELRDKVCKLEDDIYEKYKYEE